MTVASTTLPIFAHFCSLLLLQLDYLEEHDLLEDGYDICRSDQRGTFPDSNRPEDALFPPLLLALIWVLDLSQADFHARKASRPQVAVIDMKKKDSVRFLALLGEICSARLAQYPTSLQDDEQLAHALEQNPPQNLSDYRMTMALHVRIGEKQILYDAMHKATGTAIDALAKHAPSATS